MPEQIHYVYMLCDPRKEFADPRIKCGKQPFYIGKGKGPRARYHLVNKPKAKMLANKINKIRSEGFEPILEFYQIDIDQDLAFSLEKQLIAEFGRINYEEGGFLVNRSEGGIGGTTGVKLSEETKARMSLARQNISIETRRKLSEKQFKRCRVQKPDGTIIEVLGLKPFCVENNLDYQKVKNSIRFKKPVKKGDSKGWLLLEFLD